MYLVLRLPCLIIFALSFIIPAHSQKNAVGKEAPNYDSLLWVRPSSIKNETFKNKVVILEFFATWCKPCLTIMPKINAMAERFANRGVEVIAVSWDATLPHIDSFITTRQLPHNVCIDVGNRLFLNHFNMSGIPHAVMLGRNGKVVWEGVADSLTAEFVENYLVFNTIPADLDLADRTPFELRVSNALAWESAAIVYDWKTECYMAGTLIPPAAILESVAGMLGYSHPKREIVGEDPPGFFNFTLRLSPTIDKSVIRGSIMTLLDAALGTTTKIEYRDVEVLTIAVADSVRLVRHSKHSTASTLPSGTQGNIVQLEDSNISRLMGVVQREYNMQVIYDKSIDFYAKYDFEVRRNDLPGVQSDLDEIGLALVKKLKSLPFVVVQRAKS